MLEVIETNRQRAKRLIAADAAPVAAPLDLVGSIMAFEAGEMDSDQQIEFAQQLWDTGLWRQLQGSYGRFVNYMLEAGHIS